MRNPEAEELQDIGRGVAILAIEKFKEWVVERKVASRQIFS
tara:strand:- start:709 stop:831 length:123 start_codon:yes stop_codon:yes gene_type:complete